MGGRLYGQACPAASAAHLAAEAASGAASPATGAGHVGCLPLAARAGGRGWAGGLGVGAGGVDKTAVTGCFPPSLTALLLSRRASPIASHHPPLALTQPSCHCC